MLDKEIFNPIEAWEKSKGKFRILLVVSSPIDEIVHVGAKAEIAEIHRQLTDSFIPCSIIKLVPPTVERLRTITKSRYFDIIHFIGHADKNSIQLEKRSGDKDIISLEDFTNIFKGTRTKLIVLNNCKSLDIGERLLYKGPLNIIGTSNKISDQIAIAFSGKLYSNLFTKISLKDLTKEINESLVREFPETPDDLIISSGSSGGSILFQINEDPDIEFGEDPTYYPCEPNSNIPPIKNDVFFDRVDELMEIYAYFNDSDNPFIGLAGIAGKGKSIIAAAAAQKYGWLFSGGIAYFSFRQTNELRLSDLFRNFNWGLDALKPDKRLKTILHNLREKPVLIIFDDIENSTVDDREKIVSLLSQWDTTVGGKAILTMRSRLSVFNSVIRGNWVRIRPFPEDAAWELLIQKIGGVKFAKTMFGDKLPKILKYCHSHPQLIAKTGGSLKTGVPWNHLYPRLKNLEGDVTQDTIEVLKSDIKNMEERCPATIDLLNSWSVFLGKVSEKTWKFVACGLYDDSSDYELFTTKQNEAISMLMDADIIHIYDYHGHQVCETHSLISEYLHRYRWQELDDPKRQTYLKRQIQYYIDCCANDNTEFDIIDEHTNIIYSLKNGKKHELWNELINLSETIAGDESSFLFKNNLWEKVIDIIEFGLLAAEKSNENIKIGYFLYILALCEYRLTLYAEAEIHLNKCNKISLQEEDVLLNIKTENELGRIAYRLEDYSKALKHFSFALELAIDADDSKSEAMVLHQLGRLYYRDRQLNEAKECLQSALSIRKTEKDKEGLASTYHELGRLYHYEGNYPEAKKTYMSSLELREETKDYVGLQATFHQIGLLYYDLDNFKDAKENYERCMKLSTHLKDLFWKAHNNYRYGKLLFKTGHIDEGIELIKSAKNLSELLGIRLKKSIVSWLKENT